MNYAIWAAVSTKTQARADKVSLKVQLEKCHAAARARGWGFVRAYEVPGASRTRYLSLYHAEKHIPALHALLEAAARREFDILVIYDLNRFRELMRQVFDALCDAGVQLYILSDPREPVPPAEYSEEKKNEVGLTVGLRDIISRSEISSLQRHYRDKMPRRILDKGLHAGLGRPPYGYRKPPGKELDRNAILVPDPPQASVICEIKDRFLSGSSLTEIAGRLNAQGIPSPRGKRWWYSVVAYLLSNPFYAGTVGFGYTQRVRVRRTGEILRYKSSPITATGKHKPLWSAETRVRILAELERRGQAHPGIKTRQLSRLLYCWCGKVLWAQVTPQGEYWRCSSRIKGHVHVRNDYAITEVTAHIVDTLTHLDDLALPSPTDERPALIQGFEDLRARKLRWMDAYEVGGLDLHELQERIAKLDVSIQETVGKLERAEQKLAERAATRQTLSELAQAVDSLPEYYLNGPKEQVNADLRGMLERIIVSKEKEITLEWR